MECCASPPTQTHSLTHLWPFFLLLLLKKIIIIIIMLLYKKMFTLQKVTTPKTRSKTKITPYSYHQEITIINTLVYVLPNICVYVSVTKMRLLSAVLLSAYFTYSFPTCHINTFSSCLTFTPDYSTICSQNDLYSSIVQMTIQSRAVLCIWSLCPLSVWIQRSPSFFF